MRYNSYMERTVILYHANCPDGFGGAYAAWKKFGDAADYIPLSYGKPLPEELAGAEVYMIDMCFPQADMDALKATARSLTVLDHHEGVEDVVRSMPEFVYDKDRSGASIAWAYFHPGTPLPYLLALIEDDDLFRFRLPDTKPMLSYMAVKPFSFESWDELAAGLDDPQTKEELLEKFRAYREYFDLLVEQGTHRAKLIEFEGRQILAGQTHPMKPMVSALGNALAVKQPPFAFVLQVREDGIAVSVRGDGSVDLAELTQRHGGNGHHDSAAFFVPWGAPLPWKGVPKDEAAGH
jgi:oligoribonuclease NrnB/cAMP/cGMP phosphodiesterase (DHH superfamily)